MEITYEFQWNRGAKLFLTRIPDEILYGIAKQTLDMTISKEYIPWRTGDMMLSSASEGVRGGNGDYWIGSYTNYASSVWKMPQSTTNWTNTKSKAKWYAYTLRHHEKTIIDNAINKSWKKESAKYL